MSGLIWIQTVLHADGIPEFFFFRKVDFEKKNQLTTKKSGKNFTGGRVNADTREMIGFSH